MKEKQPHDWIDAAVVEKMNWEQEFFKFSIQIRILIALNLIIRLLPPVNKYCSVARVINKGSVKGMAFYDFFWRIYNWLINNSEIKQQTLQSVSSTSKRKLNFWSNNGGVKEIWISLYLKHPSIARITTHILESLHNTFLH